MSAGKRLTLFSIFSLAVFMMLGWYINSGVNDPQNGLSVVYKNINKFSTVVKVANQYYVDDIDWDAAFESALRSMLTKMDPHSVYISKKATEQSDEEFKGRYYGIGIEFDIIDNYLTVIKALPGSPAEDVGVMSNDRIVKIDGKDAYSISRADVPKRLKGPKGSTVTVTIERDGSSKFDVVITRGEIPTFSVSTYFMIDDRVGYLHLDKFIRTSAQEVEEALQFLESKGMKQLVFDLRGNPGGYLDEAVKIASKFLKGRKMVVFTKSKVKALEEELFTDHFKRIREPREYPLVIMVDRNSASASEIVAGAIQDYDRGLIIGERTFGKGLVQKPFPLADGSSFRLTISKYYTPSGRLIQRDYDGKTLEQYYREVAEDTLRHIRISHDSEDQMFQTRFLKRPVFGGGGIEPDSLIHLTYRRIADPKLYGELMAKKVFFEFTKQYQDNIQSYLKDKRAFMTGALPTQYFSQLKRIARERGVVYTDVQMDRIKSTVMLRLKARIANLLWDQNAYFEVYRRADDNIQKAVELMPLTRSMVVN